MGNNWDPMSVEVPDLSRLLEADPYLKHYEKEIRRRYGCLKIILERIDTDEGGLDRFTESYKSFGLHVQADNSITVLEWAPNAVNLFLRGDFNYWDKYQYRFEKLDFGKWRLTIPPGRDGQPVIKHNEQFKLLVETPDGQLVNRLCPWSRYVAKPEDSVTHTTLLYNPEKKYRYTFKYDRPKKPEQLKIYECHVGISSNEGKIASYNYFTRDVIPRIKKQGYNTVQLMAIMEHVYYASFGYQVTNFFAPTSRCGTPDDLKALIDECHRNGLVVLLDLIHSHASKNVLDGINEFDGTKGCFFHDNPRGNHELWDSRCFNYSEVEVLRYLLSNIRYWIDEYMFDGFRFDGVTSMLYHSHGIAHGFSGHYDEYFGLATDTESYIYLMLSNYYIHMHLPNAITIAEEVSGMPALCRPVSEGGGGFDYRLAMAIPDKWIKILKTQRDEDWDLSDICFTLTNRRRSEKNVAYAESHDQSLVGDKTISFHLMDAAMYTDMSVISPLTPVIERGMALHKLIRLLTYGLGGDAWLNFMGNEFGHPEWLDFPREGNNNSFHYARRQWHLVDDKILRYQFLNNFDQAMNYTEDQYSWLTHTEYISRKHEADKVIVFERGKHSLLWVFNFHPTNSYPDYKIGCLRPGKYKVVLDSDDQIFGGQGRVSHNCEYIAKENEPWDNRPSSLMVYIPCRTAILYALE
ncbi:hypothetical protein GJ496_009981 [Pomphorhynchus laevis]|nr:hypothetical protein GJ496_009981 [Pomphorhynchus laevis]